MGTPKDSLITRQKIIDAAGRLFAEKGFKGVTVRDIAGSAKVHLGALNYHFRTKEALYREVLLEACKDASISEEDQVELLTLPPEKALYEIVLGTLEEFKIRNASQWQSALLSRECRNPGPVFQELVAAYFKPQSDFLAGILAKITGKPLEDMAVQFAGIAFIGLVETCGLYSHYVNAVSFGLLEHGEKDEWFAKQITRMIIDAASQ